jgi:hypothetical protein
MELVMEPRTASTGEAEPQKCGSIRLCLPFTPLLLVRGRELGSGHDGSLVTRARIRAPFDGKIILLNDSKTITLEVECTVVTNQKFRCENLQQFKTFSLELSANNFQTKLLALS